MLPELSAGGADGGVLEAANPVKMGGGLPCMQDERSGGEMKLTIDNLDGLGETDYSALLDAETPPKIVRKLNQSPALAAWLMSGGAGVSASAGSKVRLYRETGGLWFSGYLEEAPQKEYAGVAMGAAVFRIALNARGEMLALDRAVLSERAAMGGRTAGAALKVLTQEVNAAVSLPGIKDVADAGTITIETGELWSTAAAQVADGARAVVAMEYGALSMNPVGTVTRTLSDSDAGFLPESLKITASGAVANDVTVVGGTEPALYVRDCFTASGKQTSFAMSRLPFQLKTAVQVEDDFHEATLDATKWVSDFGAPLAMTNSGISCAGAVGLRFRDRLELGGLLTVEQTGLHYVSGQGVVGGLYCHGSAQFHCVAGVMLDGGQVKPVIDGVTLAAVAQLSPSKRYEFRTMVFHPEPIRAGQVYSSSVNNGANARSSQVWFGTSHIVLTMRELDPADASTTSVAQTVIYDGTLPNLPAYADYLPLWGLNLNCTLGHARAVNQGAVWVQSAAPGQAARMRLIGDITAGAECYLTSTPELHFSTAAEPVAEEQIEVFYRARGLACGRVLDSASVQALQNSEDSGRRVMVLHITSPAPRTSLDCEQAARALLDDVTQARYSGEYQAWVGALPQGATDVQPGEQWTLSAACWGVNCKAIVREVEIDFQGLADGLAQFRVRFANDGAQPMAFRFARAKRNALIEVVSSDQLEDVSMRPAGLPDARVATWGTSVLTMDAGADPVAGGGIEVRVEGDWGWGLTVDRNLVGRYPARSFTLPRTTTTQEFYMRQYDASTPPKYSPYATVLHVEV